MDQQNVQSVWKCSTEPIGRKSLPVDRYAIESGRKRKGSGGDIGGKRREKARWENERREDRQAGTDSRWTWPESTGLGERIIVAGTVEPEKGEKERDGGNYFRFRALGIGYTFSPRVWLGEVVVTASFLHCHGQPVVTWLFRRPRPDLRWPRPCGKFTIDWFSGRLSTGSVRLSICYLASTFDTERERESSWESRCHWRT